MARETTACETCAKGECSSKEARPDESPDEFRQRQELATLMCRIGNKILVMSGKGGVGKSTVAANLALALAQAGCEVGLLDVDLHGPSVPLLLGLDGRVPAAAGTGMAPLDFRGLKVMSIGFLLRSDRDAVIWRGPLKAGVIRQFLTEVDWGELDYLVVDCPPGTGDEPLSVAQLLEAGTGAVVVTTPQELALLDVRKSITFCRQVRVPVLGVVGMGPGGGRGFGARCLGGGARGWRNWLPGWMHAGQWPAADPEAKKQELEGQMEALQSALEATRKRLAEIEPGREPK